LAACASGDARTSRGRNLPRRSKEHGAAKSKVLAPEHALRDGLADDRDGADAARW